MQIIYRLLLLLVVVVLLLLFLLLLFLLRSPSFVEAYINTRNDNIATRTIKIWPLKTPATLSAAISLPSTRASIPKKTSKPAVRLRKNLYFLKTEPLDKRKPQESCQNWYDTYIGSDKPKYAACSISGVAAGAAALTPLLNLVPSELVTPIS